MTGYFFRSFPSSCPCFSSSFFLSAWPSVVFARSQQAAASSPSPAVSPRPRADRPAFLPQSESVTDAGGASQSPRCAALSPLNHSQLAPTHSRIASVSSRAGSMRRTGRRNDASDDDGRGARGGGGWGWVGGWALPRGGAERGGGGLSVGGGGSVCIVAVCFDSWAVSGRCCHN